MSVSDLVALVEPPARPRAPNVAAAEQQLAMRLPDAYTELATRYGAGVFDDWLTLLGPDEVVAETRELASGFEDVPPPYSPWPQVGGLVAWGVVSDAATLCWVTRGDSSGWPTVAVTREGHVEHHEVNCATLIVRALTRTLHTELIADDEVEPGEEELVEPSGWHEFAPRAMF